MNDTAKDNNLSFCLDGETIEKLNEIAISINKTNEEIVSDLVKDYIDQITSKMKTIICNDFSLDMLDENCIISVKRLSLKDFNHIIDNTSFECCIGDKKIADSLGLIYNKKGISLNKHTRLIVAKVINDVTITDASDLKFKFFEIKYDGMWSYEWINKC